MHRIIIPLLFHAPRLSFNTYNVKIKYQQNDSIINHGFVLQIFRNLHYIGAKAMATFQFSYDTFDHYSELSPEEAELVLQAMKAAEDLAYAPYSQFQVGAAVRLANGLIIKGSNQENASSPAGICAERSALSVVSAQYPSEKITAMAVAYYRNTHTAHGLEQVISPCGICRQSITEYIHRQESTFPIYLCSPKGAVYRIQDAGNLLPLSFGAEIL